MKNYFKILVILLVAAATSCSSEIATEENTFENQISTLKNSPDPNISGHVFLADWDEWGRASKDCGGWGLCNLRSCTFCCVDENTGKIVDCPSKEAKANVGSISMNNETGIGKLIIKLNPNYVDQLEAIQQEKVLYIDNNISINDDFTAIAGEYVYNGEIGTDGGYSVVVYEN
jgi:hypothetical protein